MQFKHERLPPGHIRILTIQPSGDINASIECDLEAVHRDGHSDYTALSYTWAMNMGGDVSLSRSIFINGAAKPVSQNLFEGLLRFRKSDQPFRMWIDAVCIKQDDDEEKTEQVASMASIYANASRTIVWLGEGEHQGDDAAAAAVMRCFAATYRKSSHSHLDHSWTTLEGRPVNMCMLKHAFDWRSAAVSQQQSAREGITQCLKFLRRRYFRRRWVVQELHHSKEDSIDFCWGGESCSEADLDDFLLSMSNEPLYRNLEFGLQTDIDQRDAMVSLALGHHNVVRRDRLRSYDAVRAPLMPDLQLRTDLTVVLDRCEGLECADPRDRIYSLLSLDPTFGVVLDYTLTPIEVFTSFTRLLLEKHLYMCVFHNLVQDRVSALSWGLPSWVPDLRRNHFTAPMERPSDGVYDPEFSISIEQDDTLSYSPYLIGKVTAVSSPHDFLLLEDGKTTPTPLCFDRGPWLGERHGMLQLGDVLCTTDTPSKHTALIHILRKTKAIPDLFRILRTVYLENESHDRLAHGQKRIQVRVV